MKSPPHVVSAALVACVTLIIARKMKRRTVRLILNVFPRNVVEWTPPLT